MKRVDAYCRYAEIFGICTFMNLYAPTTDLSGFFVDIRIAFTVWKFS